MKKKAKFDFKHHFIKTCAVGLVILSLPVKAALATHELSIPNAPKLDAETYILMDAKSGTILAEHQANTRRDPASLTKMMTSYIVGDAIKQKKISLNDTVPISRSAWALGNPTLKGSSVMFLKPGDKVSVAELNRGIIIQSGNDACIAMAEYMAGSQDSFVSMMNNYARQLGLKNTHFKTVHGLDADGQYTTAYDMARLGKALIDKLPNEYHLYKEKYFTFNNIKQINRNGLLWDPSLNVDGIKTGHTHFAGYNLVASATEGNTRLISAVLGGRTFKGREEESKKLLTWGFRFFETITPIKTNKVLISERIWYGKSAYISLGSRNSMSITIPKGRAKDIMTRYKLNNEPLSAPIAADQVVGSMQFILDNTVIAEKSIIALEQVDEAGIFIRLWHYITLSFSKWFS